MNRPRLLALLLCLSTLSMGGIAAQTPAPAAAQAPSTATPDQRPGALDMVLIIDKSLSMAPFFQEVKAYAAQKVLEPILVAGDRLIIETVYGRVDRLFSASISSEEDKAKAIRAVGAIKADGAFTDLGAALDKAKKDLDELGQPERPKYVLMLSDERQEAPMGSPYQAPDYKLKHPSLEYIKKVDLGKFRAITVGIQVGALVERTAPDVWKFVEEPPVRSSVSGTALPAAGQTPASGSKVGPSAGPKAEAASSGGMTAPERALPPWLLSAALALLAVALAGLAFALLLSRRKKKEKKAS